MSNKITFFCQGELNRIIDLNKGNKSNITCEIQSTSPFGYMFLNQDELDGMNVDEIQYPEKTDKIQKNTDKELLLIKPDNDSIVNIETAEREGFMSMSDDRKEMVKKIFLVVGILFILIFFAMKFMGSGASKFGNPTDYFNRGVFSPVRHRNRYM